MHYSKETGTAVQNHTYSKETGTAVWNYIYSEGTGTAVQNHTYSKELGTAVWNHTLLKGNRNNSMEPLARKGLTINKPSPKCVLLLLCPLIVLCVLCWGARGTRWKELKGPNISWVESYPSGLLCVPCMKSKHQGDVIAMERVPIVLTIWKQSDCIRWSCVLHYHRDTSKLSTYHSGNYTRF